MASFRLFIYFHFTSTKPTSLYGRSEKGDPPETYLALQHNIVYTCLPLIKWVQNANLFSRSADCISNGRSPKEKDLL